eukprot:693365-Rhodomonas_salina.1
MRSEVKRNSKGVDVVEPSGCSPFRCGNFRVTPATALIQPSELHVHGLEQPSQEGESKADPNDGVQTDFDWAIVDSLKQIAIGESSTADADGLVRQIRQRNASFGQMWMQSNDTVDQKTADTAQLKICKQALSRSLPSIKKLLFTSSKFPQATILSQFAAKIVITLYLGCRGKDVADVYRENGEDSFESCKKSWLMEIKQTRMDMKSSSKLKNTKPPLPLGAINYYLTYIEIGVMALKEPGEMAKFFSNTAGLFKGVLESFTSFSLKPEVFKYGGMLGKQALAKTSQ